MVDDNGGYEDEMKNFTHPYEVLLEHTSTNNELLAETAAELRLWQGHTAKSRT